MEIKELLQSYLNSYDDLAEVVKSATEEMLYYKPSADKWSAVEIIVHLADAECNGYVRFRKAIAEPGKSVDAYDHEAWALKLDYQNQNIATALALFKLLRMNNFHMLSKLDDKVWNNFVIHSEKGKITLAEILKIYTDHLTTHINQIKRNFQAYNYQIVQ